jgi:carbonic anhydrase/acetyltransferase-like protein (isoleucine patch superfamily)
MPSARALVSSTSMRRDMRDNGTAAATVGAMSVYALGQLAPVIHPDAFVHPDAVLIGDVHIGSQSSVWPSAVVRGDNAPIVVGARTSVQDGAVIHSTEELTTTIGDDCVIGHLAHLEGCTIESGVLIGVGAVVLHRAVVRSGAVVAAGAVVLNDTDVPAGALAMGVPARVREGAADAEMITSGAAAYVGKVARYKRELRRLDG